MWNTQGLYEKKTHVCHQSILLHRICFKIFQFYKICKRCKCEICVVKRVFVLKQIKCYTKTLEILWTSQTSALQDTLPCFQHLSWSTGSELKGSMLSLQTHKSSSHFFTFRVVLLGYSPVTVFWTSWYPHLQISGCRQQDIDREGIFWWYREGNTRKPLM